MTAEIPQDDTTAVDDLMHFQRLSDVSDDMSDRMIIPCGVDWLEDSLRWRMPETCVILGPYGGGKSLIAQYLAMQWANAPANAHLDAPVWYATLEDNATVQADRVNRSVTHGVDEPDKYAIAEATRLKSKILVTARRDIQCELSMDWVCDQAVLMKQAHGTNFVVIDPWNEFDHEWNFRKESETQYVKRQMKKLRKCGEQHNIIFVVVTHITKSAYNREGGITPFRINDAMGSGNFGTSADRGICVLRTSQLQGDTDWTILHFDKIKEEGLMPGYMGQKATFAVRYSPERHAFTHSHDASSKAGKMWSNGGKVPPDQKPSPPQRASGDNSNVRTFKGTND